MFLQEFAKKQIFFQFFRTKLISFKKTNWIDTDIFHLNRYLEKKCAEYNLCEKLICFISLCKENQNEIILIVTWNCSQYQPHQSINNDLEVSEQLLEYTVIDYWLICTQSVQE